MTDRAKLERGYWRLLGWYPRAFRREYGPEIVAVLLACARAGQRRPGVAEPADLIRSGLRMRLRPGVPRPARTVRAAIGLMYAGAAVSTALLNQRCLRDHGAGLGRRQQDPPHATARGNRDDPGTPMGPVAITTGIVGGGGVAAVATGLHRVLQAARPRAGSAAGGRAGMSGPGQGSAAAGQRASRRHQPGPVGSPAA